MRHIAAASLFASWVALACSSGQGDARSGNDDDPKTPVAAKTKPQPEPTPSPTPKAEIAPTPAPPEEPAEDDFGDELCETIIPCYQKLEFAGNFMADVSVDIEADGSVSAVSFTGEAPKPVQTCITDAIKATKLQRYNGKPGRMRCTKSGQLMGGTQMIMSDQKYELRDPGAKPKAEAEAKDGKAGAG